MRAPRPARFTPLLDPGWLFLVSGLALLIATVLIPAYDDLADARYRRDVALAVESRALERVRRHADYLESLRRGDERLALSLAAQHLSLIPEGRRVVPLEGEPAARDLNPFAALEPPPVSVPRRARPDSILQRWTTDDRSRLWLLAGGSMCILMGLLPPATHGRRRNIPTD